MHSNETLPTDAEIAEILALGVMAGHIKISGVRNGEVYYELTEAGKRAMEEEKQNLAPWQNPLSGEP